jgi:hypothetical protein
MTNWGFFHLFAGTKHKMKTHEINDRDTCCYLICFAVIGWL